MKNIIKKKITRGFLLFLFTFFSLSVQAQWDENALIDFYNNHAQGTYVPDGNGNFELLEGYYFDSNAPQSQAIDSDGLFTNDYNSDMLRGPFTNGVNSHGVIKVYVGNVQGLSGAPAGGVDPVTGDPLLAEVIIKPIYHYLLPDGNILREVGGTINTTADGSEPNNTDTSSGTPCTTVCFGDYKLGDNCNCVLKPPCVTKCDGGYSQDRDTCECKLLPPCFGVTVEGLMPNGSGNQSKLVKAIETIVGSFFAESEVFEALKKYKILDPKELSKGFDNYVKAGGLLDKLSLAVTANDYLKNPTTENLMKVFVDGALAFLPLPASLGYTAVDTIYQKRYDGATISEFLAKKMAEFSGRVLDCDLGSGVYGIFH